MSKQKENERAKEIHRRTGPEVRAYRCGYSGSNAMPQPDILVTTPTNNHAIELKHRQGPTATIDSEDLDQLAECQNSYTIAYLVVKFPRYEPIVIRYYPNMLGQDDWNEKSTAEKFAALVPKGLDGRVTPGGNLGLTLNRDQWTSTKAGRPDTDAILDALGVPHESSTTVEHGTPQNPYTGIH